MSMRSFGLGGIGLILGRGGRLLLVEVGRACSFRRATLWLGILAWVTLGSSFDDYVYFGQRHDCNEKR